ncbi:MAG: tRNA pseudouridine(38-40) synthase TruA, partial [Erysipelotrichaceae bacterium]|nr:tRNA pseudouridine(38-40) synthase TruA [Erysipelotrichaceae bacterium]
MADGRVIYKAVIAYDGSEYGGFQKQINALGIQEVIEKALSAIHKYPSSVTASGRTDAKVHALGQVIHFEGRENMSEQGYYNALNTMLPKDVRVLSVRRMPADFHARFSARAKHYDYIYTLDKDNPFTWRYKTPLKRQPDLEKMRQAAAYLTGEHDFTAFSNAQIHPDKPRVKTIYR